MKLPEARLASLVLCVGILACAAQAPPDEIGETRFVVDGVLVSVEDAKLAIKPDDAFVFVGSHPFRIRDVAAGERFVFVDAEEGAVERLFLVQFEAFLPGVDNFFRYDLSQSPTVAGYPFRSNGFAFDLDETRRSAPDDEAALTAAFLDQQGYSLPAQWMMWRSLTVPDAERKSEIILFYVENVAGVGKTLDDLYEEDRETEAWQSLQVGLEQRANASFALATLDVGGRPEPDSWTTIPNGLSP